MFVSIHIPKTAGTSLSTLFDFGCHRRVWYDYSELKNLKTDLQPKHKEQASKQQNLLLHKPFIEEHFDFVHGHFFFAKYEGFFANARFITCVREPIKRLISHYFHMLDEADESYWLYREVIQGHIDLVDLAKMEFIGDLQSQYLKGRSIKEYDFVFIAEKLPESFYHFQLTFNFQRNDEYMNLSGPESIPHKNNLTLKKTERIELSNAIIRKAILELEADNELYQQALGKFVSQGYRAHGINK